MAGGMSGLGRAKRLRGYQRLAIVFLAFVVRGWTRTLRFELSERGRRILDHRLPPTVTILWHNRLFVAPEFYRRYGGGRRLAALVSASGDGAWLSAFLERLNIRAVRGSRYKRGAQAIREMIEANRAGYDVAVTPDGSRGPIYEMKPGAVAVALKTGAPILLVSFNFRGAWRLKSWDGFYLPHPFSRVRAEVPADRTGRIRRTERFRGGCGGGLEAAPRWDDRRCRKKPAGLSRGLWKRSVLRFQALIAFLKSNCGNENHPALRAPLLRKEGRFKHAKTFGMRSRRRSAC